MKRWRKLRKESGFKPTYLNQALRFFCEFSKASCELPALNPFGSKESHEQYFKETEGGLGRSLFEFLSAARRTLLDDLNGERIIERSWPEIDPHPPLDPSTFTKENLERHFFSYYAFAQDGGEGRVRLKALLAFHRGGWDPHTRSLIQLLQTVADNSFLFTSTHFILRFLIFEYLDYSPLLDKAVEIDPEAIPLDPNQFTKETIERHFFTYYAIVKGEHGLERKNQLNALLDQMPRGNPYTFKLLYVLKAAALYPIAFDSKNDFIRYLEEERAGRHPRSTRLQSEMQTALLTDKVIWPFVKYQGIYQVANAALGSFSERLGAGYDPITKIAYERALASAVKGDGTALAKKGVGALGLLLLRKLPLEVIGHSLAVAATYVGLANPATGIIGGIAATAALRFGLTRLLDEPFTWRHVVPAPTVTIPAIKGAVKGVKALSAMYSYTDVDSAELPKVRFHVDLSSLTPFKTEWERYFAVLGERLALNGGAAGQVLLELHLTEKKLSDDKERFETSLLALFNLTKTRLITPQNLQEIVHKGDWGAFAKEPFNLTPDMLPQLALALERLKIYHNCLARCRNALGKLERFIETPTLETSEALQRAFGPVERGEWDPLIEAVAVENKTGHLIAVKLRERGHVIPFWKEWRGKTGLSPKEIHLSFERKDEPEYLANAIFAFKTAKDEGIPLILSEADFQALRQIHEAAAAKSQQKLQTTLLLQMLDQGRVFNG